MLLAGNILGVFLEATRQHWLTTHVARKEGSDNFKMGCYFGDRTPVLIACLTLVCPQFCSEGQLRRLALASCLHRR
jgi:hypothetical protein